MVDAPPLATFTTLETWLADEFVDVRFRTQLFGAFALVAMLLAGIGLYGVVSSGVARRTHEFGVRLALGAEPGHLRREVLLSGTRLALLSLPLGAPLAWLVARPMTSLLYGVSALDWPTLAGTATVLIGISVLACWFPARRASRVPPIEAMRV